MRIILNPFSLIIFLFLSCEVDASHWSGYYVRGGVSSFGWGRTKTYQGRTLEDTGRLETFIELAAGWGQTFLPRGGCSIRKSGHLFVWFGTSFYYSPNLQLRLGIPFASALPYVGGGIGYTHLMTTGVNRMMKRVTGRIRCALGAMLPCLKLYL